MSELFRALPAVDALLRDERVAALPRPVAVAIAREVLDSLREGIRAGTVEAVPDVAAQVVARARDLLGGRTPPAINATGVVIHTNLGRAPWAPAAIDAAVGAARYCAVELDLESGRRGRRLDGVEALLRHLTGAEASVVVNNCAAAVLLALTTHARGRAVVVSRGELVEIGGSFRVPDVIASGGAHLVGVGTTNRTRIGDYERAISDDTAVLMAVHPSNYRVVGFTEAVHREQLVALARAEHLVVVEDLGSGSMEGDRGEPAVREAVAAGVDVVTFSGDKLLGGPQAGLAVGRAEAIRAMRRHPMYRALRLDKVAIAALEATLAEHAAGRPVPVQSMLTASDEVLAARAEALRAALAERGVEGSVGEGVGYTGGGALPGQELPSWVVTLAAERVDRLAAALRTGAPTVVARVADGALVLDVRTLTDDQLELLAARVASALHSGY